MQRSNKFSNLENISSILRGITSKFASKFGDERIKLINDWDIVGLEYAKYSYPLKVIKYSDNMVLNICVTNSSVATMISFSSGVLIERINTYFGHKVIDKIKIIVK